MSFRSCSRALARVALAACFGLVLLLQVVGPPLAYAVPSTDPAPQPRRPTLPLLPPVFLEPGSPLLPRLLPILLAQVSGYDAGSATAGGLLGRFSSPTQQGLPQVPNYSDAALNQALGNTYYRQAPTTPDSPSPLKEDADAATRSNSTLQLIQNRALASQSWHLNQASQLLRSLESRMPPDVGGPAQGPQLLSYCAEPSVRRGTQSCQVTQSYEELSCHEYSTEETRSNPLQTSGERNLCVDHFLRVRLFRDPDTQEILLQFQDYSGEGILHKNCGDGAGDYDGWHTFERYAPNNTEPTISISAAGPGCTSNTLTLDQIGQQRDQIITCGADGAQYPVIQWTTTFTNSYQVTVFNDGCADYKHDPWFIRRSVCRDGNDDACWDMERVVGKLTPISSTCKPLEDAGCTPSGQTCEGPDCLTVDRTYTCTITSGCARWEQTLVYSTCIPDPPNPPRCINTTTPVNTDFGLAAAVMEGQVILAGDHDSLTDPPDVQAFPGVAQKCTKNLLVNCCNSQGSRDAAQNIQTAITAAQYAMQAYRVSQFAEYTYTIMSVGNTLIESAWTAAQIMSQELITGLFAFSWSLVFMVVVIAVTVLMQLFVSCDEESTETATKRDLRLCIEVGEYCAQKALFFCWKKAEGYCCFSTLIARIIQEQGRAQLGIGWGDPKNPDCRGLTVAELQAINWDAIDWREYLVDLQKRVIEPTTEAVEKQAEHIATADFAGQAVNTINQYGSLRDRVASSITVPGSGIPGGATPMTILTVTVNGAGSVQVSPGGGQCGRGTCQLPVPASQVLTAAATPGLGSSFDGWSGACVGAGACTFSLTGTSAGLTATFSPNGWPLTVNVVGPGTVTSSPGGLNCSGRICVATFPPGATVSLYATPGAGAVFEGWSGACAGTGGCSVALTTGQTVSATFTVRPTVTAFAANTAFPVPVGTPITWTTTVSGGVPPIEYEFTREDNGTPVLVQSYSTTSTYTWTPTAADIGTHRLQVAVRNAGSGSQGDDFAITDSFEVIP